VEELDVSETSAFFNLTFFVVSYPLIVLVNKLGIKWSSKLCLVITAIGMCIRCLINWSFLTVNIGQIIGGISTPIMFIIQVKFCDDWFNDSSVSSSITYREKFGLH